ncbi:MBL fold metallo-hydrolase [Rhodococcus aerolatus]
MQVTAVGHAGFHIETAAGTILCDPWVNPAYFASWFPFPDNTALDWDALGACDFLYVSHLHKDHFDPELLAKHVSKDARVLLPDYPVEDLRRELEALGFHDFVETQTSVKQTVTGRDGASIDVMIVALRAPADGPIGDSGLVVDDGETVLFNMNDSRPVDLDPVFDAFGRVDVHLLQYSGAIWYPMVYDMPERAKVAFGTQKRQRQMDRARRYVEQVGASWVVPSAGPPAFLDDALRSLNDDHGDPANIFPDQWVFLDQLRRNGAENGLLMVPGTEAEFHGAQQPRLTHPVPEAQVEAMFTDKAAYLEAFAQRQRPVLAAAKASWAPDEGEPLLPALKALFEPVLAVADQICAGIGGPLQLDLGEEQLVVDFPNRVVRPLAADDKPRYGFAIAPGLVRTVLRDGEPDWVNSIFLSTRFRAWRIGGYNEYVYTFFKCLTDERMAYADGWFAEAHDDSASITVRDDDGQAYEIQRRCPHLKADLSKFGVVEGATMTCDLHGWSWDLRSGRCLTSKGHELRTAAATPAG